MSFDEKRFKFHTKNHIKKDLFFKAWSNLGWKNKSTLKNYGRNETNLSNTETAHCLLWPLLDQYGPNKGHVKHSAVPLLCKVVSSSVGHVTFPGIFPDAGAFERL